MTCSSVSPFLFHNIPLANTPSPGDSRTPHYNLPSRTTRPRFCVYTCYMPVADASQEDLLRKKDAFESKWSPPIL